jgi:hypothetical protein
MHITLLSKEYKDISNLKGSSQPAVNRFLVGQYSNGGILDTHAGQVANGDLLIILPAGLDASSHLTDLCNITIF